MFPIEKMLVAGFPQTPMIAILGIVIHDTADTAQAITHAVRVQNPNAYNEGITTFWCDESRTIQTVPDGVTAYHLGNYDANQKYIGIEVCRSRSDESLYLKALQNAYELAKYLCDVYGLSYSQIFHHKQFYNTACPHRRYELFGANALSIDRSNVSKAGQVVTPPKPTPPENKGDIMRNTLPYINTKVTIKNNSKWYMRNALDSVRTDIPDLVAGEEVIAHHVFIQDTTHSNLWYTLCYRPDRPDAVALVQMEDLRNGGKWINYTVINEYFPPKPIPPKVELIKFVEPIDVITNSDLFECKFETDKVIIDEVKSKILKRTVLKGIVAYVDFNKVRFYFNKDNVGTSLCNLVDVTNEAKHNLSKIVAYR